MVLPVFHVLKILMKNWDFALMLASFLSIAAPARAQVTVPEELKVGVGRLGRVEAKSTGVVKWINLHADLDLIPDSSGKWAFVLSAKAGRYKIAAYGCCKDGVPCEPAYCTIVVGTPFIDPPAPPVPPNPGKTPNPLGAICKLRIGNAGCTATVVGPRRSDGKWDILTAAHCTRAGSAGEVVLSDGRKAAIKVVARDERGDIAWMVADLGEDVPFAVLAQELPAVGTRVWHQGFGVDRPGNKEEGEVAAPVDSNGQLKFSLSVSSGDSGSAIFRVDNGEIVACVCCTASMAKKGAMWGGSSVHASKIRTSDLDYPPIDLPIRMDSALLLPILWYHESHFLPALSIDLVRTHGRP